MTFCRRRQFQVDHAENESTVPTTDSEPLEAIQQSLARLLVDIIVAEIRAEVAAEIRAEALAAAGTGRTHLSL